MALSELQPSEGAETGVLAGTSDSVTGAVKAVAELLSWFAVDTSWSGRVVQADAALHPALLGQLIARDLEPVVVAGMPAPIISVEDDTSLIGRLRRLLLLREQVEALAKPASTSKAGATARSAETDEGKATAAEGAAGATEAPAGNLPEQSEGVQMAPFAQRIASLSEALDALLVDLRNDKPGLRTLLVAAEACALAQSKAGAYLLQAKVIKTGGHYKLRKHLLTYLFGMNGLTYSAGAAVTFSLTDLKRHRIVLADTLFHASDEIRFASLTTTITPNNLINGSTSHPGLAALPVRKFQSG
jgi:plastocyanin